MIKIFGKEFERLTLIKILCSLLILALLPSNLFAQRRKSTVKKNRIEIKSLNDTLIPVLANRIASYSFALNRDSFQLQRNFDLNDLDDQISGLESRTKSFHTIFSKVGQNMNIRGLNTSVIMLKDVLSQLEDIRQQLEGLQKSLGGQQKEIHQVLKDTLLSSLVQDSVLTKQMADVRLQATKISHDQQLLRAQLNLLNGRVSVAISEGGELVSDMVFLTIRKKGDLFHPEHHPLLSSKSDSSRQSTWSNLENAISVSGRVAWIYGENRLWVFFLVALLITGIWAWCRYNLIRMRKRNNPEKLLTTLIFLRKRLWLGALLFLFAFGTLAFADPPAALLHFFDLLQMGVLLFMIYPILNQAFKKWFLFFVGLWLIFLADDLLLSDSNGERWLLFIICLAFAFILIVSLMRPQAFFKNLPNFKLTRPLTSLSLILVVLSCIFNLTGNFNLSKILAITSIQSLFQAFILGILFLVVMDAAYLQSEATRDSRVSRLFSFERIKGKLSKIAFFIALIIWVIGLIRSLSLYSWFSSLFWSFLDEKRVVGQYDFTFSSIFIFVIIIWVSSFISKIINFFFGYEKSIATGKRSRLNSLVLIFRLVIWTIGFLIAVAAAGIPLDKISIMLGALGVGIGFGLQNIVNNLVSGIILAFERPVQVGDHIEVGGKSGMIKEIGVRASKINNWEGADIIIPNGDLLSQQVTNWTIQNRNKRAAFILRIPYKTDLGKMKELVMNFVNQQKGVLQKPVSLFVIKEFSPWFIEVQILFWTPELGNLDEVRTRVMMGVKELLSKEGIELQSGLPPTPPPPTGI